jgi:hypothetical protein
MKTQITSVHEEQYSDGSRTLGVLFNYSETVDFKESFIYIYHNGRYIFFDTMIDMMNYLLYGNRNNSVKRAYMDEDEFDALYDADYINGKFSEKLIWQ